MDIGSGVWIGKNGYVVTCQHVIASTPGPYAIGLPAKPYVSKDGSIATLNVSQIFDAQLIDQDAETDVAILKVTKKMDQIRAEAALPLMPAGTSPSITPQDPVVPRGAILESNIPDLGESLFVAGYPLGGRILILRKAAATAVVLQPLPPNKPVPPNSALSKLLRIALFLPSMPGDSGVPVFDAAEKVVGLLQGTVPAPVYDSERRQLFCTVQKRDADKKPMFDADKKPLLEDAPFPCIQSSGVAIAVPAKFIADLAKNKNIDLQ